jgi:HK97 family phage portal protein
MVVKSEVQEVAKTRGMKALIVWPVDRKATAVELGSVAEAYRKVPLIRRAVHLRASAVAQAPVHVYRNGREVDWPFPSDLRRLLWRTEVALLLHGAAYWLKVGKGRLVRDVQWLNPATVKVEAKQERGDDGRLGPLRVTFVQRIDGQEYGPWGPDEMVYFAEYDPGNDVGPGVAAASTALSNANLLHYLAEWSARYFEHGAMPVTMIVVPDAGENERRRLESKFKRLMAGVRNAWRVLATSADIKPHQLTPSPEKLVIPQLHEQAMREIAWAFDLPLTMLTDAANFATAREHRRSFWTETMAGRLEWYAAIINEQLFAGTPYKIRFAVQELDLLQEDEQKRASAVLALVQAGMELEEALDVLGYDLPASLEGAREGMTGAKAGPKLGEGLGEIKADLALWRKKALRTLKARGTAVCRFDSDAIPPELASVIREALAGAETPQDVHDIFAQAETWGMYP